MNKILAVLFMMSISVGLSILTMINGWGLEVKSWWWIIGVGFFCQTFIVIMTHIIAEID